MKGEERPEWRRRVRVVRKVERRVRFMRSFWKRAAPAGEGVSLGGGWERCGAKDGWWEVV